MAKARRHSEQMNVRLTPDEAATLREAADSLGLTVSDLLRLLVRNAKRLVVSLGPTEDH